MSSAGRRAYADVLVCLRGKPGSGQPGFGIGAPKGTTWGDIVQRPLTRDSFASPNTTTTYGS